MVSFGWEDRRGSYTEYLWNNACQYDADDV